MSVFVPAKRHYQYQISKVVEGSRCTSRRGFSLGPEWGPASLPPASHHLPLLHGRCCGGRDQRRPSAFIRGWIKVGRPADTQPCRHSGQAVSRQQLIGEDILPEAPALHRDSLEKHFSYFSPVFTAWLASRGTCQEFYLMSTEIV